MDPAEPLDLVGAQASTAWPPPSPNQARASSGRRHVGADPEWSAAFASATASPPSETSWMSEQRGAARQRNSTSAASAARSSRAAAADLAETRLVLEPAMATGEAPASRITSPARQRDGTRRVLEQADAADDRRRVDRAPSVSL